MILSFNQRNRLYRSFTCFWTSASLSAMMLTG